MTQPTPPPKLPWPSVQRRTLANGLTVVALQRDTPSAALALDIAVGARYEAPADAGLSHFLEHMIFQGCVAVPQAHAVNLAAERLGSILNASTGREHMRIEHSMEPEALAQAAQLMAQLVHQPLFEDLESERKVILEEALDGLDDRGRLVDGEALSRQALWPDQPLGQRIIGSRANIMRFGAADLRRHHQRYFGARNMVLTVMGPAPVAALHSAVEAFATLPSGQAQPPPPVQPSPPGPLLSLVDEPGSQVECRLIFRTPGREDACAPALQLLQHLLDDGLSSRLQRHIGGRLGLAYDLWAFWEPYSDAGLFEIGALTSPENAEAFFEQTLHSLGQLAREAPGAQELEHTRFRARWAMRQSLEDPETLADFYGLPLLFGAKADPEAELVALYALEGAQLSQVTRDLLDPSRRLLCAVGPLSKKLRRALRPLGLRTASLAL